MRLLDAVDHRELGVPLPRLVHQPRVLERHAQAAGERRQQPHVVLARTRSSGRGSAARSGRGPRRRRPAGARAPTRRLALRTGTSAVARRSMPSTSLIDKRRLRLEHAVLTEAARSGIGLSGSGRLARSRTGSGSVRSAKSNIADVDDLRVEDLLDLVADDVVDRLHARARRRAPPGRC